VEWVRSEGEGEGVAFIFFLFGLPLSFALSCLLCSPAFFFVYFMLSFIDPFCVSLVCVLHMRGALSRSLAFSHSFSCNIIIRSFCIKLLFKVLVL